MCLEKEYVLSSIYSEQKSTSYIIMSHFLGKIIGFFMRRNNRHIFQENNGWQKNIINYILYQLGPSYESQLPHNLNCGFVAVLDSLFFLRTSMQLSINFFVQTHHVLLILSRCAFLFNYYNKEMDFTPQIWRGGGGGYSWLDVLVNW